MAIDNHINNHTSNSSNNNPKRYPFAIALVATFFAVFSLFSGNELLYFTVLPTSTIMLVIGAGIIMRMPDRLIGKKSRYSLVLFGIALSIVSVFVYLIVRTIMML